jgi:hypothetical protein
MQCKNCGREVSRRGSRGPAPSYCSRSENPDCFRERAAERQQLFRRRRFTFTEDIPAETRRERSQAIFQTGVADFVDSYGRRGTYGRRWIDSWRRDNDIYRRQLEQRLADANGDEAQLKRELGRAREARSRFEAKP